MAEFNSGPCESWTPIFSCALPTGSEAVSGIAVAAATEVLWKRTGQRFGLCTQKLRPCASDCFDNAFPNGIIPFSLRYPFPYNYRGLWYNLGCGGCPGSCSCTIIHEAILPAPVANITEVKVDGVILAPSAYRVDDQRLLVRLDGDPWPVCNDLNHDDTEIGTWSVTAQFGEVIPQLGLAAVGELAMEFIKYLMCDDSCSFPTAVQSVQRQGVSMSFFDPDRIIGEARIGLFMCDLFVETWNPSRIQRPARVFDVGGRTFRRAGT